MPPLILRAIELTFQLSPLRHYFADATLSFSLIAPLFRRLAADIRRFG
jgi:hypothetical protein